jgi:hypothetical protein
LETLTVSYEEILVAIKPDLQAIQVGQILFLYPLLPGQVKWKPDIIVVSQSELINHLVITCAISGHQSLEVSEIPQRVREAHGSISCKKLLRLLSLKLLIKDDNLVAPAVGEEIAEPRLKIVTAYDLWVSVLFYIDASEVLDVKHGDVLLAHAAALLDWALDHSDLAADQQALRVTTGGKERIKLLMEHVAASITT